MEAGDDSHPAALRQASLVALQTARSINTLVGTFCEDTHAVVVAKPWMPGVSLIVFVCSVENLNSSVGFDGRVHASLNLNTTTGRLSCKAPNLQNQPALEKDKYQIRKAFVAPPGKSLIVADYGQLELRVLAHIGAIFTFTIENIVTKWRFQYKVIILPGAFLHFFD